MRPFHYSIFFDALFFDAFLGQLFVASDSTATYVQSMLENDALPILSAIAQITRLKVLVILARAGSSGMASGDLADAVGIPRHLMSSHLAVLSRAKVVVARKTGRAVVYSVDRERISQVGEYIAALGDVAEDCAADE